MLFSIIVPVYGVEAYLAQTVRSVRSQDFHDWELILVDDGAKDRSGQIADECAAQDDRIRVIHKQNGGVSSARNTGLFAAKGEYIVWLDGDDLLFKNSLSRLAQYLEKNPHADIILQNYQTYQNNAIQPGSDYSFDASKLTDADHTLSYLFGTWPDFPWAIWANVYRREMLITHNLLFDETMSMNEDGNWLLDAFLHARTFGAADNTMYVYRIDVSGSLVHQKAKLSHYESSYKMYTRWFSFFASADNLPLSSPVMTGRLARGYVNIATSIYDMDKCDRKKAIELFAARKEICAHSAQRTHRPFLPILRIFGVRCYLRTICMAFHLKEKLH